MAGMSGSDGRSSRPRLNASERARRNAAIAGAGATGMQWKQVAERFRVSVTTAKKSAADHAQAGLPPQHPLGAETPAQVDPQALFLRVVAAHEWAIERASEYASAADQDSVRIGALRTVVASARSLVELLAMVGLYPQPEAILTARVLKLRAKREAKERGERMVGAA
jgi:hypothetical protein